MFSIYANGNKIAHGQKEFLVDELNDLLLIPTTNLTPGTTAFVIANSQTYMLNHNKQWIKVNLTGGSPSSPDPEGPTSVIYDGGVI